MNRIKRISRLRNNGIFRDFSWPTKDLYDFGKYNLIYGWNGTGKTTLSRLFRNLESSTQPEGKATIQTENGDISEAGFTECEIPVRVFNRDLVQDSIFRVDRSDIPPIYVVGIESAEKQKKIDALTLELKEFEAESKKAEGEKEKAEKDLNKHCSDRAKVIRDTLQRAGSDFSNYRKGDYEKAAEKMAEDDNASDYRLTDEQREAFQDRHIAKPEQKVDKISYRFPNLQALADGVSELLQITVVSASIPSLVEDHDLAEWVRQGVRLHREPDKRESDKCLFCDTPLPEETLARFEAHFNAEYENFLQKIESEINSLKLIQETMNKVRPPDRANLYDELMEKYDAANQGFEEARKFVDEFLEGLINELAAKKAEPFKRSLLTAPIPEIDINTIDQINHSIHSHNQMCDNFQEEVNEARQSLALDMVAESLGEFVSLRNSAQTKADAIEPINDRIAGIQDQIRKLEAKIRQHQRPAEELNKELKSYLGHGELEFAIKDTGYTISRRGEPAASLSEGETTAIALLYFLKSLKDQRFDLKNGVVVLDDPVSSLDVNALHIAVGFIKARIEGKGIGQMFIFTHNFTFFKEIRNWFKRLKDARLFMMNVTLNSGLRTSSVKEIDPFLKEYESEYYYLFARVYKASKEPTGQGLEKYYFLPNMARRLLEAFLNFRQPNKESLWTKLQNVNFNEPKKLEIYRFLNIHSHSADVGEQEHDPTLLARTPTILANILEMIKSEDPTHHKAMCELSR